jgi:hypothetical protein
MDHEVTVLGRVKALALALGFVHWLAPVLARRSVAAQLGLGLVLELVGCSEVVRLALAPQSAKVLVMELAEASQKALA